MKILITGASRGLGQGAAVALALITLAALIAVMSRMSDDETTRRQPHP